MQQQQRLIPVFGAAAFLAPLTPEHLYRAAQEAPTDEQREAVEEFAFDLATIRGLPESAEAAL